MREETEKFKLVFVLIEDDLFGWLPEAYAVGVDENGEYTYHKRKAYFQTLHDYKIRKAKILKRVFEHLKNFSWEELEKKFVEGGRGKPKTLEAYINNEKDKLAKKRVQDYVQQQVAEVLRLLIQEGASYPLFILKRASDKYTRHPLTIAEVQLDAVFHFNRKPGGEIQYSLTPKAGNETISLKEQDLKVVSNHPGWVIINDVIYATSGDLIASIFKPFVEKDSMDIPKKVEEQYFRKFIIKMLRNQRVEAEGFDIVIRDERPKPVLVPEQMLKTGEWAVKLAMRYGSDLLTYTDNRKTHIQLEMKDGAIQLFKTERKTDLEQQDALRLENLGLIQFQGSYFVPPTESRSFYHLADWLSQRKERLIEAGYEVVPLEKDGKQVRLEKPKVSFNVAPEGNDWLDLFGEVQIGRFTVPFLSLKDYILSGNREYQLPDGTIALLPEEWFSTYKELFQMAQSNGSSMKLARSQAGLLDGLKLPQSLKNLFTESHQEIDQPFGLQATLRPYQMEGLNWLNRLRIKGLGGCLADEMGLGKTLMSLALLQHVKNEQQQQEVELEVEGDLPQELLANFHQEMQKVDRLHSLIVMPLSLVHNWEREINKFAPQIKVHTHIGLQRTREKITFSEYDIVLTTYHTLRNDVEMFSKVDFHYMILDESQAIKNPKSKTFKAVREIRARHKLVLTGTPIENSLSDLWSQISFVNPGMLGSYNFFRNEFILPIEKTNDEEKRNKLRALVKPLILRRRVQQVAQDLPELSQQVFYTEMEPAQKRLYEEEKSKARNKVLDNIRKHGTAKSNLLILRSLMKLRQIANHPALLKEEVPAEATAAGEEAGIYLPEELPVSASGKFNDVTGQIEQVVSEDHKVLVFSQFVEHLKLYRDWMREKKISYSFLTGSHSQEDRDKAIQKFQDDPTTKVFLISLKAGGTGLNLTAASYVYLLDPWWNPAVEAQAVSRAHRIGQDKRVFAYRFIAAGTVEEKILRLQEQKKQLASDFLPEGPSIELNEEEVGYLFE